MNFEITNPDSLSTKKVCISTFLFVCQFNLNTYVLITNSFRKNNLGFIDSEFVVRYYELVTKV